MTWMSLYLYNTVYFTATPSKISQTIRITTENDKHTILTSTNNLSPIEQLLYESKTKLNVCFQEYTRGKETEDCIKILGFPIISKTFINKSLNHISYMVNKNITLLQTNLDDIQTVGRIFNNSLLPKFYHTLCADMFLEGIKSNDIFHFESDHTTTIKKSSWRNKTSISYWNHSWSCPWTDLKTNIPKWRIHTESRMVSNIYLICTPIKINPHRKIWTTFTQHKHQTTIINSNNNYELE